MGIAAARQLTEVTKRKSLGTVGIECQDYPVLAVALKEILKEEADVYEGSRPRPGAKCPSCIVLCPNGQGDLASEVRRVVASNPQAFVFVFDMREDPRLAHRALLAGASGFLHAGMRPEQIARHPVGI